jgi:hypothetical protein
MRYILFVFVLFFCTAAFSQSNYKSVNAVAAGTGIQGDATLIVSKYSFVTGSNGTKGVRLPNNAQVGGTYEIYNADASTLRVYPYVGSKINAGVVNSYVTVAARSSTRCVFISAGQWVCSEAPPA